MPKRFCVKCGLMRDKEDFREEDGKYRPRECNRDHSKMSRPAPRSPKKALTRAERKRRNKMASQLAYPVEIYRIREKKNRQTTPGAVFRPQGLTRAEYAEYLQSDHWCEFVEEYRRLPLLHECFVCGDERYDLHHITYSRIGNEHLEDVVPLCRTHHKATHQVVKAGQGLRTAHTYVKMRFQRGELGIRVKRLDKEE